MNEGEIEGIEFVTLDRKDKIAVFFGFWWRSAVCCVGAAIIYILAALLIVAIGGLLNFNATSIKVLIYGFRFAFGIFVVLPVCVTWLMSGRYSGHSIWFVKTEPEIVDSRMSNAPWYK
jgi:hypothetical protein